LKNNRVTDFSRRHTPKKEKAMTEDNRILFTAYLEEEKLKGHSEQGIINLKSEVPHVIEYLEENNLLPGEVRIKQAYAYQGWLIERGTKKQGRKYSNRTICAYISSASNFYEYLKRIGMVPDNPFKEIRKVRCEKKLPRNILKEKEMNRFLKELSYFDKEQGLKRKITRYKVHVAAELMYATGLRISEVADLRVEDIDIKRGVVIVKQGKGGVSRLAWLNYYTCSVLKLYIERMRPVIFNEWNERNNHLLFGVKWSWFIKVVNKTLQKVAKSTGLAGFTSHGFRHAVGYHLLRAGCNIRYIQQILGHKRLKNTEVYTKVDKEDLKEVLDTYHPRKFKRVQDEKADKDLCREAV
jgi:site-specific recombinase XerD